MLNMTFKYCISERKGCYDNLLNEVKVVKDNGLKLK